MLLARDDQPMRSGFHAGSLVNTTAPSRVGVATDPGVNIQDLGKSCIGGCLLRKRPGACPEYPVGARTHPPGRPKASPMCYTPKTREGGD